MLTRLKFRRNYKLQARCLSEKAPENDERLPEIKDKQASKIETKAAADSTKDKLQQILKSMLEEPKMKTSEYRAKFAVAQPLPRKRKQRPDEIVETEQIEESIAAAATDVAKSLGGDTKQTEAELLSKVLGKINEHPTSLSDLLLGMKLDRSKEPDPDVLPETRGQQVKRLVQTTREHTQKKYPKKAAYMTTQVNRRSTTQPTVVDIFNSEPLGIFTKSDTANYGTTLNTWTVLSEREKEIAVAQPPKNYFQKMIQWTNQGKVWKFPINNEQGLEDEDKVHFSEHIFMDAHLEGWCPPKGPIRHFMELVCVGLSKNPFYTAQEKREHIMWYKEYFESKKDLLNEVGAWSVPENQNQL